jgi:hypothetical protein
MKKSVRLIVAGTLLLGLSACAETASTRQHLIKNANFWQRASVSDAAYMDGPKSQQMLHRDIARCVTELRELEQLGTIRNAIPAENARYRRPQSAEHEMSKWDTPERDAYLLAEHGNYHDFETCMIDKGWERVEHVPYDVAKKSRENYVEAITGQNYRTKMGYRDNDTDYRVTEPEHNNDTDNTGLND